MSLDFDADDMPAGYGSTWLEALPEAAERYRRYVSARPKRRVATGRLSRAKPPGPRMYAGVPVVVRRAVKAHVRALWRARRAR
jgi:hypothetical protein